MRSLVEASAQVRKFTETKYQQFFQKAMKKFGIEKLSDLKDDEKKKFYDYVDRNWKSDDEEKGIEEASKYSDKQIKMAYGILNDPRWKSGNMTAIVKKIEQIAKGLSKHPSVEKAIRVTNEALEEGKSSTGYELYHKDFSTAMKHAYDFAKKKFGIEVDPKEIDDKVASGPRKPSKGKTNSYRLLDKDGKKAIQVQVYGMDNGKYELNMYKEEVQLDEGKVEDTYKSIMKGNRRGQPDDDEVGDYIPRGMTKADMAKLIDMLAKQGYDKKFLTKDLAPLVQEEVELDEAKSKEQQIADLEKMLDRISGNTSAVKMKKYALQKKIDKLKNEELEEAYKTPAEAKAYEAGKKAWRDKKKYDTNPNKKGTPEHTAWSKGHNDARAKFVKKYGSSEEKMRYEEVELDENKNLIKDYQDMKAQGKKDHNILDVLMSMPKYKRMSKDQMAKIIGDAKRKGIFKEEVELTEESKTITKVREIVDGGSYAKIGGVMVDLFTASAIIQIYDKVNDANKAKMDKMNIKQLANVAYKMMKRESLEENADSFIVEAVGKLAKDWMRGAKSIKQGSFELVRGKGGVHKIYKNGKAFGDLSLDDEAMMWVSNMQGMKGQWVGDSIDDLFKHLKKAHEEMTVCESCGKMHEGSCSEAMTESFKKASMDLTKYAQKSGGMDKGDFLKVAKMLSDIGRADLMKKSALLGKLSNMLRDMDTDPRDKVYEIIKGAGLMESMNEAVATAVKITPKEFEKKSDEITALIDKEKLEVSVAKDKSLVIDHGMSRVMKKVEKELKKLGVKYTIDY